MDFDREAVRRLIMDFQSRVRFAPAGDVLYAFMALATETPDHWTARYVEKDGVARWWLLALTGPRLIYVEATAHTATEWTWDNRGIAIPTDTLVAWAKPLTAITSVDISEVRTAGLESAHIAWRIHLGEVLVSVDSSKDRHTSDLMASLLLRVGVR